MVWHRHFGVYGICTSGNRLLVIHKNGGPYNGRFDLPGGSLEPNETMAEAVRREFAEETGLTIAPDGVIGTIECVVPWTRDGKDHTHCHHIAVLYGIRILSGTIDDSPNIDDSNGPEWIDMEGINESNGSPLVIEALKWIREGTLSQQPILFDQWTIY